MLITKIGQDLLNARKAKLAAVNSSDFDPVHNEIVKNLLSILLTDIKSIGMAQKSVVDVEHPETGVVSKEEVFTPRETTEEEAFDLIKKYIKNTRDAISKIESVGRDASKEKTEVEILLAYMPAQLTLDEIETILVTAINANQIIKNIGAIMKHLKDNFDGQYDAKAASAVAQKIIKGE